MLARVGSPVGLAGFAPSETWGTLALSANDAEQAVIGTRLPNFGQALIGYDPSLGLVPLVRSGDVIEVSPGVSKTVESLTLPGDDFLYAAGSTSEGRGVALNDAGEVVYRAVFTDQSQAIVRTRIPVAGDATFDGLVNFSDFEILFNHFGQLGDRSDGDFNSDGMVDFADFQLLERNFGRAPAGQSPGVSPGDLAALEAFAGSVPEPGAAATLALTALCGLRRRR